MSATPHENVRHSMHPTSEIRRSDVLFSLTHFLPTSPTSYAFYSMIYALEHEVGSPPLTHPSHPKSWRHNAEHLRGVGYRS